jgi:type II secretory pathway predicted ATPase ExeA
MYETHFGFHRQPFQCADLSRTFYASESIRRILPQLLHSLRSSLGIALVTAPRGAGRTTLLRHIQNLFDQEARTVILPGASLETSSDLQRALLLAALKHAGSPGQSLSTDLTQAGRWNVIEQLRRTIEFWGPVIVLVDDCQLVPVPVLNELRSFTEEEWNGRGLVRALVTAPMNFEEELARPVYTDFSRRIRCHAFLQPLTTLESVEFLRRHIEAVGTKLPHVLTADAIELLTQACEGLPRSLALLADETLLGASELGRKPADGASVRGALSRLQHLPYHWNVPAGSIEDVTESERSDDHGSEVVVEIAPMVTQSAASHSSIVYQSAGVIEFGAPSRDAAEYSSAVYHEVSTPADLLFAIESEESQERVSAAELPPHVSMSSAVEPDADSDPEVDTIDDAREEFAFVATPAAATSEVSAATPLLSSMITESQTLTPSAFEVGHRFFATSGDTESVRAVEPGQDATGLLADHFSDFESAESFVDLADDAIPESVNGLHASDESRPAFGSTSLRADEPRTVTYSQQPVQYYSNSPLENVSTSVDEPTSVLNEAASFPGPAGRNHGTLSLQGFSSRIPVFDRYTWLALGREVPAGRYSVTSTGAPGMAGRLSPASGSEAARAAHGLIPIVESTDAEIDRWLSGATSSSTEGEFILTSSSISSQYESMETVTEVSIAAADEISRPFYASSLTRQAEDIAVGVEYYNNPVSHDESSRMTPVSIQDRIAAVVEVATAQLPASDASSPVLSEENRSLIRDALRTSLRAEIEAAIDSGVMQPPPLPANTSSDTWADGSLVFGSRSDVPPAVTRAQADSDVTPISHASGTAGSADRLFTIPVDLNSIDWDLRSSIMEFPEVAPLAQSVDELRSEVSDFHASGRGGQDASSGERTRIDLESDDESLVAKARRRLYTAALADIEPSGTHEEGKPQEGNLPAPVETVPAGSEADARFSTLFTRLRSMRTYRKDSVE